MPYTTEEFARCYRLRGLGTRREAREYSARHGLSELSEADFEACWREAERPRQERPRTWAGCAEPYLPEDMPNSQGRAFEDIMRREQRINDALERAWRTRGGADT